jgi:hypothetical protein
MLAWGTLVPAHAAQTVRRTPNRGVGCRCGWWCQVYIRNETASHASGKKLMTRFIITTNTFFVTQINYSRFSLRWWNITQYNPLKINRRFGGTCRMNFRGPRVSQTRKKPWNRRKAELFSFLAEDGGDMFNRNVSCLSTEHTSLYPRRHKPSELN